MMRWLLALLLLIASPVAARDETRAPVPGMVSSAHPLASAAGQEILRAGGSATDAAMAMMLALTVVEPQSSGIGGGGFLVHQDAATGLLDTVDGRETAPASATPALFLGPDGKPLPFRQAVPGGRSVGVPGNIALMARSHGRWGRLPWPALFAPAIRLAREGFPVSRPLAAALARAAPVWVDFPAARALYWIDGKPAPEGATIRNPQLAAFLEALARSGPWAFYTGDNAAAIAAAVSSAPNAVSLTLADLAAYRAKDRPAVCAPYRAYRICGMGPPSSGATSVAQILGMLERFDLAALGKDNPQSWHLIAQAMRLAYADRDQWLGDRDFVAVPVAGLLDPAYVKRRSALIATAKAPEGYEAGTPPGAQPRSAAPASDVPGTTHFIAIDRQGSIATMTSTVEGPFGSQLLVNGYFLNNELTDFSFAPDKEGAPVANRVEPGKRPLSSMAPTIVYDAAGKPVFAVGAAGGRTIIMQVAKAIVAHLDWGLDAREALGLGLVYFRGDELLLEEGSNLVALKPALEALGHKVGIAPMPLKANAAQRTPAGWQGAADPRSIGVALTE